MALIYCNFDSLEQNKTQFQIIIIIDNLIEQVILKNEQPSHELKKNYINKKLFEYYLYTGCS